MWFLYSGHIIHVTLTEAEVGILIEEIQKEVDAETKKSEAATGDL